MKELALPELTKASSKGQIVIPAVVRRKLGIKRGTVFAVGAMKDLVVLKKLETGLKPNDLRTIRLIEEAWEDMKRGRYKVYSKKAFFKELKKW